MSEQKPPPVVVKDLSKSFKQPVLQGVNLKIDAGQIVTILGRSGTGKSVLLKLLIGLAQPDSGSICLDGKEIAGLSGAELNDVRKKIGFLFQQAALYDSMTIGQNVGFPLQRHEKLSDADRDKRVKELLAQVGMEKDEAKMPGEISGGMKKRVGIARALALNPEMLMLDEPTAGLDPITSTEITELICKVRDERKATCIVVTHDLRSARKMSDRFVVLNEGKIRADGSFKDLEASNDPFVVEYLKDAE